MRADATSYAAAMRATITLVGLFLCACGAAAPASAPQTTPAAPAVASPLSPAVCESAGHRRDFDFWLGDWEVHGAQGKLVGENRIEVLHGGCALLESWRSAGGGAGSSLNFYDPASQKWRQVWVDRQGGIIDLAGQLEGKAMVLEGTSLQPDGSLRKIRGTWTPQAEGKVRQVFEEAPDGATWQVTFDGLYSRKP